MNLVLHALAVVAFFLVFYSIVKKKSTPRQLPLPPGPKGLPFLGNIFQINRAEPWLTYVKWRKSYGEIVSYSTFGQTHIILNSERVARALLDQRSSIYSDRPAIGTSVLFGMEFNTGHLSYGDAWKCHRKFFQQCLNSAMVPRYYELMAKKTRLLLANLSHYPERFEIHAKTFSASVTMAVAYGYDTAPKDDPFVTSIEESLKIFALMTPERAILFNAFPQLLGLPSWFPGAELHKLAKRCRELTPMIRHRPFQFVKDCLAKDIENDSMVSQLLREGNMAAEDRELYEQNIKDCATSGFIGRRLKLNCAAFDSVDMFLAYFVKAGSGTMQLTLTTLIMVMILYPEAQNRAQALLDSVVGKDRLPTFDDRSSLQYIDAIIRETIRWGAFIPGGVPHRVTKDDVFNQWLIPEGSVIIPNMWGMARDEEKFPDPTVFKPERHLDAEGNLLSEDLAGFFFGYGRRACPGRCLANAATWIAAASMLSAFRFSKAIGPDGREIEVTPKFTGGVALRPNPFLCRITPRFEQVEELIG